VIAARLEPRLVKTGCGSFYEYYRLLSGATTTAADEWLHVVAILSKPKTRFYRHTKPVQLLVNTILPQWLLNGSTETLKIWSAGCSTGEEPLTIAMALAEAGWFDRIQIEILGSDASYVAIEKARRGVYSESRIRDLSPELRIKYFIPANEGWQVGAELHKRVRYSVTNLMSESETAEFAASHIIFCCNVFIYFSADTIRKTLRLFGERMPARGYLFTDKGDYFESLMSENGYFEQQEFSESSVWIKRLGSGPE
jgi:chemotaxis protein methyltransferase CheR